MAALDTLTFTVTEGGSSPDPAPLTDYRLGPHGRTVLVRNHQNAGAKIKVIPKTGPRPHRFIFRLQAATHADLLALESAWIDLAEIAFGSILIDWHGAESTLTPVFFSAFDPLAPRVTPGGDLSGFLRDWNAEFLEVAASA